MLINKKLRGKTVATVYGTIFFNDKGENNELTKTQQQELGKLASFTYVEDKKPEPKKPEPKKKEVDQEPKKQTKKAPAKKKTVKKDEK